MTVSSARPCDEFAGSTGSQGTSMRESAMDDANSPTGRVIAGITTSVDGYVTGPDDGPGLGLGRGGERLHYWVMGGPWTYDDVPQGGPSGAAREFLDRTMARIGAIVVGRWMYEAAGHWG